MINAIDVVLREDAVLEYSFVKKIMHQGSYV